ncbi:TonB-dependent receptor [Parabacteroides sp. FAFU027]|uniref:TonB-dependent receptor n=1 Tax=Parabacteroides sp. FAFU027 TaxID=2922715 RepID=UPI001FAF8FBE|nr:TonB-dependent receptor [Parabacteroides sp. FAFU027]
MKNNSIFRKSHYTRFFCLVVLSFFAVSGLFAQVTVNVKNQPIRQILKTIEKNTEYRFFYNNDFVALNKVSSLSVKNSTIDNALKQLFTGTGISWEKKENNLIVLTPDKIINVEKKSSKGITGTVKDSKGEPIIGANIVIKGTTNGTITDVNGNFSMQAPENTVLTVSYIGFLPAEKNIGKSGAVSIILQEDTKQLEEVVVVGYGTMKRKDVTTAVTTVSTKDITERPIVSAAQAIQGKAAGVQVMQPSGQPGAGMVVRVRGSSSITASNDPLYVVDGVPMTEINFLAPSDIESMQILKDASSAAIYGSRASNGVVLITTKNGAKGDAKISLSSYYGVSNVIKHMKSLNVAQYKELMDENGAVVLPDGLKDETDWFNETYRTGLNQNYQLSVSNGNDKMRYFISGGYTKDAGVIKVAYYERYNLRANLENQIRSWFKLSTNMAYSDYSSNGIISGTGANRAGVVLSVINTPTYGKIWDETNPGWYYNNFYGANVTHPVENMSRTKDNNTDNNRFLGTATGEITFSPALKYKTTNSLDRVYYNYTSFLDPVSTSYGRSQYGSASDTRSLSTILIMDNILTYDKVFGKHTVSALGGTSYTTSQWSQSYQTADHFSGSDIKTLNAANKVSQGNGTSASDWAIMSYIGRLAYNYNSKYLATINFRSDGSSKLAPKGRWGYFPSASVAWRISSEDFMKSYSWINDLKLRGGWGKTGNQSGIGDYSYLQLYGISRQNWWETGKADAMVTLYPSNLKNEDLTWETTTQSNIGVDFTMLNNRLTLNADAYYKYTTNLLMNVPLPSTASVSSIYRNEGEMQNKGLEFGINSKNITGKFQWETDFNFSMNRNKVTKLTLQKIYYDGVTSEATSEYAVRMTEGKPLGMFWGYVSEGVDPETGDIKYKDLDGNGKITSSDKTYIGNPNPKFTYGLTNNFSYKGFNLNVFFQGSYGNDIYNASRIETEGMYDAKNQSTEVLRRWKILGQITDIPRAVRNTDNIRTSTRFIEDGSYLRLKTLTLSYNVPSRLLKKWSIGKIQPYLTAQNLLTLTKYKGFDPEVNQWGGSSMVQGIDWGSYPQVKTFIFGVNVEL